MNEDTVKLEDEAEKSIKNLKKYIEEDVFYNGTEKIKTDFDKFCYNHCADIDNLIKWTEWVEKSNEVLNDECSRLERKEAETEKEIKQLKREFAINYEIHKRDIEIKELRETIACLHESDKNYISKKKIEAKIEKYKQRIEKLHPASDCQEMEWLEDKIDTLKELLESEEN